MKKTSIIFVTILCFLVAACVPTAPTSEPTPGMTPDATMLLPTMEQVTFTPTIAANEFGLTAEKLYNAVFFAPVYQKSVHVNNGKFENTDGDSSFSVVLLPQIAIGDLNDDLVEDAAVLLAENGGGSGVFVTLVVIGSQDGEFLQMDDVLIDDRPIIQSLEISGNEIILTATIHGINDAMIEPTLDVKQTYRLLENQISLMSMSSTFQGGMERLVNIEFPIDGSEISNPIKIKGSMPVAPFENNLSLTVYDMSGNILYLSGFMVDAIEPGSPATFDSSVDMINLPSNSWVRLVLTDVSMADGSIIAMDSVIVKIK